MNYDTLDHYGQETSKAIKRYLYEIKNNRVGETERLCQETILKARISEFLELAKKYTNEHPKKTVKKAKNNEK